MFHGGGRGRGEGRSRIAGSPPVAAVRGPIEGRGKLWGNGLEMAGEVGLVARGGLCGLGFASERSAKLHKSIETCRSGEIKVSGCVHSCVDFGGKGVQKVVAAHVAWTLAAVCGRWLLRR